jgi:hypothetical protein
LKGCIAKGHSTLFSALMKAGKSTWLGHLLKAVEEDGQFIGLATRKCRTLIVSEESPGVWCRRRDLLGLTDALAVLCRPMLAKPSFGDWTDFVAFIAEHAAALAADLIVFDSLSAFAPWKSENDSADVQGTVTPFNRLMQAGHAVLAIHHLGKADASEGKAARGSTALAAAFDILLEMRRYKVDDLNDRRRVIRGLGRFDEVPSEIVAELLSDGTGYTSHGDRKALAESELVNAILAVLPNDPFVAMKAGEVHDAMDEDDRPRRGDVMRALRNGAEAGLWSMDGSGKSNSPFRFWKA